ncbi:MAG: NifU family protein [Nitrospinota bacterium]
MRERVEEVLDRIRPAIMMDGGNVELVDVVDGVVTVRLLGACHGCPSSTMTLQFGIEQALKDHIPEVERLVTV